MTPQARLGVVIDIKRLKALMLEYVAEMEGEYSPNDAKYKSLQLELTLSGFLAWLQRRQHGKTETGTGTPNHGIVRQFERGR